MHKKTDIRAHVYGLLIHANALRVVDSLVWLSGTYSIGTLPMVSTSMPGLELLNTIGVASKYDTLPSYGNGVFAGDCT